MANHISEGRVGMTSPPTQHYHADVVMIGFGAAGGCAAIEAHDAGVNVVLLEKQLVLYEGAAHRLDECAAALEQLLMQWIPATLRAAGSP